jgi:3-dehydroquinate synthase
MVEPPIDEEIVQRVAVRFEYPVVFTRDVFGSSNDSLARVVRSLGRGRRLRALVCIDEGVAAAWPDLSRAIGSYTRLHADLFDLAVEPLVVPGGEASKNDPREVTKLHELLFALGLDRQSLVLAIGGGAVLDLVGYAAATAHRGVRLVRFPTTVLAQNDAGIGVKNGVNAFGHKNALGTFQPPAAVLNDASFLGTLPRRDAIAGHAEAIKVASIKDEAFFRWLEAEARALAACEPEAMAAAVRRCAELHLNHIASNGDPFEQGSARPLDYGHWSAHKLELMTAHDLRHGEAVAIGMALDARYAVEAGLLSAADADRFVALLGAIGLPRWHDALDERRHDGSRAVLAGLDEFRQHLGGELTLTMLTGIGRAREVHEVDLAAMNRAFDWLRDRAR